LNWLFILGYVGLQLCIGIWIAKRIHSESDYFLGGRNVSLLLVTFSLFATWFGAETCMGSSAAVYRQGISGSRADPFGFSLCLLLMGLLLAGKLRRGNYVTLADYYRERYGGVVENLAVWIMVPSSLIWGAAQIRAFGQIIASTTPLPVGPAIAAAALFVLIYTLMGGLLGDIYTDFIQGIFVIIGLAVLLVVVLQDVGGWKELLSGMAPARLSLIGPGESVMARIDRWMVPVLGSLVTQELISRILAAKSVSVARKASFIACGIYLVLGSIPVFLGLFGPFIFPGLADSEQFLIRMADRFLPNVLFVVFSGALISAIISTVDSILLAISALVSHNLIVPLFGVQSERKRVLIARAVVLVSGVSAYVIAVYGRGIYELVLTASSFGTAGILVITLLGLYSRIGKTAAAVSALVAGLVLTPLATYVLRLDAPFLTSIGGSLAAFTAGALLARRWGDLPKLWLAKFGVRVQPKS
jgi:SSS family solute:Na+ symporter